jgi:hypothetical protein
MLWSNFTRFNDEDLLVELFEQKAGTRILLQKKVTFFLATSFYPDTEASFAGDAARDRRPSQFLVTSS